MRFGQKPEEAAQDTRSTGGGNWMKYMKDGDTTFRVVQEPDEWTYWWEHFAGKLSFPCTNDRDTCPGCRSDNEKVAKASRKVSFNVLEGEYVNVYKVPPLLADKLKLRFDRLGTITDREYTITRYKTAGDKIEYDVEGSTPKEINVSKLELKDVEEMLAAAYNEAWGDSNKAKATQQASADAEADAKLKEKMAKAAAEQPQDPPSKPSTDAKAEGETEVSEAELRAMSFRQLLAFLVKEEIDLPEEIDNTNDAVDWLMANAAS